MEKAKECLELAKEDADRVARLTFPPHRAHVDSSFYEYYSLRGIRVDRVEPGFVSCTFKVPPRLLDRNGNLASGAVANLVDEMGGALVHVEGLPMNVSVDMSICYLSTAKLDDELEIVSKLLGQKGGYSGTLVLVRNKTTGELIAEGRHSLFGKHASKMYPNNFGRIKTEASAVIIKQLNKQLQDLSLGITVLRKMSKGCNFFLVWPH